MIGMAAVVTKDVPPHALAVGNPARVVGWLCTCGRPLERGGERPKTTRELSCEECSRKFQLGPEGLREK